MKQKFDSWVSAYRGKNEYDALLCYSGGKDSSYSLKLLADQGLKILAYTMDNGFLPQQTIKNIRIITTHLQIDHFFLRPQPQLVGALFQRALNHNDFSNKTIERGSLVCASCIGLVKYSAIKLAVQKRIPIVAFGWTPGQASIDAAFLELNANFVRSIQRPTRSALERASGFNCDQFFLSELELAILDSAPTCLLHPSAFLEKYDEKKIFAWLRRTGWMRPSGLDANSTNCLMNSYAVLNHMKRFGFNPYDFEIAMLVRGGFLTRREGLRRSHARPDPKTVQTSRRLLSAITQRRGAG